MFLGTALHSYGTVRACQAASAASDSVSLWTVAPQAALLFFL